MFALSDGCPAPAHPDAVVRGDTYRFTVLTSRLIRMEWNERGDFVDERTQLVVDRAFPVPEFRVEHRPDGGLEITTEDLLVRYDGRKFSEAGLSVTLTRRATDDHYSVWHYGTEPPHQPPWRTNLGGTARTLDLADGAIPLEEGILATYGFAVVDDSESALQSSDGWISARPEPGPQGNTDIYLFAYAHDFKAALRDYCHLAGPIPMVPRFVLGNWWSRYWPYTEADYVSLMDRFAAEGVPLSVSVIDMDWHLVQIDPEIGTGWTGYTWNRDLFPDPERFLRELHERGLAVTLNVHPADGVRRHEDAYRQMAEATGVNPDSGLPVPFDITSRVFVDAYLRYLHHPLEAQGVDFWWLDWQSGGVTGIPGLDPLWMLNHIHYVDSGRDGKRPLTFSRYAGPGSHRYPIGFSGDAIITWESLDFQPYFTATAANVAYTWWSHDIGGHMFGYRDDELATRWVQFGVFSPVNRLHSSSSAFTNKEPWAFGPRECDIMTRFLRLRHRLIPELYTAAWKAHTDAVGVVRPLYHDHPDAAEAYREPNEALVGQQLLVAPITAPADEESRLATTKAWLPEGGWFDLFTGQRYGGGRHVVLHRPLDQYPVLARAGAVLPLADPLAPLTDAPDTLSLRVYPGAGESELVEDHGEGTPQLADRTVIRFVQDLDVHADGTSDLQLVIEPATGHDPRPSRTMSLEIVGASGVTAVEVDGRRLPDSVAAVSTDEVLSPALRIEIGTVTASRGATIRLLGLHPAAETIEQDTFALLDAARIPYLLKDQTWRACKQFRGLRLAQELEALNVPVTLREALLEKAAAERPW